jgi:quercetin dioxygenase-like cupin family protein
MTQTAELPSFLKNLPEAEIPVSGIRGLIFQSEEAQAVFIESHSECRIPEHSHGDQWGIVVRGILELTIGGETKTYTPGDSYFIPAGTIHKAVLSPGFCAIDFFSDKNRYRPRAM